MSDSPAISSSSRKGLLTSRLTRSPSEYEEAYAKVRFVWWLPKRVRGFAPVPQRIYINRRQFAKFDDLDTNFLSLLFHETWHLVQMRRVGWLRWIRLYLFSREARLMWEAEAHVFGEMQMYPKYPVEQMEQWAESGVKAYFRVLGVPMSATELEAVLHQLWMILKEYVVVLEYEL